MPRPKTVGELRQAGYAPRSVKAELRQNLIARMERDEPAFPGIVGYDESVLPQLENAILAGQDVIFLGERGQARPGWPAPSSGSWIRRWLSWPGAR